MSCVTVSRKGQVVIPANLRRQLGIQPGSRVEISAVDGRIEIELQPSATRSSHAAGFGMLKYAGPPRRLADFDVVEWVRQEPDFADALHLSRAGRCERFYTFDDRKFARRAAKLDVVPQVQVP